MGRKNKTPGGEPEKQSKGGEADHPKVVSSLPVKEGWLPKKQFREYKAALAKAEGKLPTGKDAVKSGKQPPKKAETDNWKCKPSAELPAPRTAIRCPPIEPLAPEELASKRSQLPPHPAYAAAVPELPVGERRPWQTTKISSYRYAGMHVVNLRGNERVDLRGARQALDQSANRGGARPPVPLSRQQGLAVPRGQTSGVATERVNTGASRGDRCDADAHSVDNFRRASLIGLAIGKESGNDSTPTDAMAKLLSVFGDKVVAKQTSTTLGPVPDEDESEHRREPPRRETWLRTGATRSPAMEPAAAPGSGSRRAYQPLPVPAADASAAVRPHGYGSHDATPVPEPTASVPLPDEKGFALPEGVQLNDKVQVALRPMQIATKGTAGGLGGGWGMAETTEAGADGWGNMDDMIRDLVKKPAKAEEAEDSSRRASVSGTLMFAGRSETSPKSPAAPRLPAPVGAGAHPLLPTPPAAAPTAPPMATAPVAAPSAGLATVSPTWMLGNQPTTTVMAASQQQMLMAQQTAARPHDRVYLGSDGKCYAVGADGIASVLAHQAPQVTAVQYAVQPAQVPVPFPYAAYAVPGAPQMSYYAAP